MLQFTAYRQHVEALYAAALAAVEPGRAVRQSLLRSGDNLTVGNQEFDLRQGRVFLVSVGKAAVPMAEAAIDVLGDALHQAVVISKRGAPSGEEGPLGPDSRVALCQGSHPVSGADSVAATAVALDMVAQAGPADLVICLISGGASALLTQPLITLADWQALVSALLASGCTINELNAVRRQLDRVKGGGLAQLIAPAQCVSLILSDVVGNPLEVIGSGPTVSTQDSPDAALAVLARYDLAAHLPPEVVARIQKILRELAATAVSLPPVAGEVTIVGDVRQAAMAALTRAVQLGFVAHLLTVHLEGEAREVGRVAAALAKDTPPGRCLILGGETTVTLRGDGTGGRNQELTLAAALALEGWPHVVIASVATDGEDGPTPAAGAVISGQTAALARQHDLDPEAALAANDSYCFFASLDQAAAEADPHAVGTHYQPPALIDVGSTGTNVNDLLFILTYSRDALNGGAPPLDNQTNSPIKDLS